MFNLSTLLAFSAGLLAADTAYRFLERPRFEEGAERFLPWTHILRDTGVFLSKNFLFGRTWKYVGPDLRSSTDGEIESLYQAVNRMYSAAEGRAALYLDQIVAPWSAYPPSRISNPAAVAIDRERREKYTSANYFRSAHYISLVYTPPTELLTRRSVFLPAGSATSQLRSVMRDFEDLATELEVRFQRLRPKPLSASETARYLHFAATGLDQSVAFDRVPFFSALSQPIVAGARPSIGERHLRAVSVIGFRRPSSRASPTSSSSSVWPRG